MILIKIIDLYSLIVFVAVILSWFQLPYDNPAVRFVNSLTEPLLQPIRRVLPDHGQDGFLADSSSGWTANVERLSLNLPVAFHVRIGTSLRQPHDQHRRLHLRPRRPNRPAREVAGAGAARAKRCRTRP